MMNRGVELEPGFKKMKLTDIKEKKEKLTLRR